MLKPLSVQVHGNGDEVLVSFDRDGTAHNELLRDAPEIARKLRALDKEQRALSDELAQKRDAAHRDRLAAVQKADDDFQAALDELSDANKKNAEKIATKRDTIHAQAFKAAEKQMKE